MVITRHERWRMIAVTNHVKTSFISYKAMTKVLCLSCRSRGRIYKEKFANIRWCSYAYPLMNMEPLEMKITVRCTENHGKGSLGELISLKNATWRFFFVSSKTNGKYYSLWENPANWLNFVVTRTTLKILARQSFREQKKVSVSICLDLKYPAACF